MYVLNHFSPSPKPHFSAAIPESANNPDWIFVASPNLPFFTPPCTCSLCCPASSKHPDFSCVLPEGSWSPDISGGPDSLQIIFLRLSLDLHYQPLAHSLGAPNGTRPEKLNSYFRTWEFYFFCLLGFFVLLTVLSLFFPDYKINIHEAWYKIQVRK